MSKAARQTSNSQNFTLFLIGMRFNSFARPDRWAPVMIAFPRMMRTLTTDPQVGLLGAHNWLGRTTISVQYWESTEKLQAFAANPDGPHLKPWRDFIRLGKEGHVGIWHETYECTATGMESIYVNMPSFGAASALGGRFVGPGLATARKRLTAV